jgi:hypothetical protein
VSRSIPDALLGGFVDGLARQIASHKLGKSSWRRRKKDDDIGARRPEIECLPVIAFTDPPIAGDGRSGALAEPFCPSKPYSQGSAVLFVLPP